MSKSGRGFESGVMPGSEPSYDANGEPSPHSFMVSAQFTVRKHGTIIDRVTLKLCAAVRVIDRCVNGDQVITSVMKALQ